MGFEERLGLGVQMALEGGMDAVLGLPSVLLALADKVGQRRGGQGFRQWLSQPQMLLRVARAVARSKLARRSILPKDLWSVRGIAIAGSDSALYRERIKEVWGQEPLEVSGCTEGLVLAMQTWDFRGMTFVPNLNFLEFIPEEEHHKSAEIPGYRPYTLLLDELSPGGNYELVITSLLGGCFIRYRLGDLVTVTERRNDVLDIDLPQVEFYSRDDSLIDLGGFTRLTEKTIGQALAGGGVTCRDWIARREDRDAGVLHIYVELKNGHQVAAPEMTAAIHQQLKQLDAPYADIESMLGLTPLRVTLLPKGTFERCVSRRRAAGVDPAQLRPPHINPSDDLVAVLLDGVAAYH